MRKRCTGRYFIKFFDQLAGTSALRIALEQGKTECEIRESWQSALVHFKKVRKKYLLYEVLFAACCTNANERNEDEATGGIELQNAVTTSNNRWVNVKI